MPALRGALLGGISILVEEEDLKMLDVIADTHDVPGYKSIESDGLRTPSATRCSRS